ncbi:MAG TPA: M17 family peptidase N-terminal domain-containing protein, partial [Polyangiaceae bacterium]|nr:M17 family peptidase N-terminal domain-containing protein [Polyangiaceae bacterium]
MTLRITFAPSAVEQTRADALAIPVVLGSLDSDTSIESLDRALDGQLRNLCNRAEFTGRADQVFEVSTLGRLPAARIILIGIGEESELDEPRLRHLAALVARTSSTLGVA